MKKKLAELQMTTLREIRTKIDMVQTFLIIIQIDDVRPPHGSSNQTSYQSNTEHSVRQEHCISKIKNGHPEELLLYELCSSHLECVANRCEVESNTSTVQNKAE